MPAFDEIMGLGHVTRWHIWPTAGRSQTVADHSAKVALIAEQLAAAESFSGEERLQVMRWALVHDAHEQVFGDVPKLVVRWLRTAGIRLEDRCMRSFWGSTPDLSAPVRAMVDAADLIEAAAWASIHFTGPRAGRVMDDAKEQLPKVLRNHSSALIEALGMLEVGCGAGE